MAGWKQQVGGGPPARMDKGGATRTVATAPAAMLGMVFFAVLALRGTMPDGRPADTEQSTGSSTISMAGIMILLSVSMLVVAVALLTRSPRQAPKDPVEERRMPGVGGAWSWRRLLVLGVGAVMALVVVFLVLNLLQQLSLPWAPKRPEQLPPPPPADQPGAGPRPGGQPPADAANPLFGYLAATVTAMAVLMVLSAVIARRRRGGSLPVVVTGPAPAGAQPLAVAAERGLAAVEDHSRDPREAIIACYAAMELALVSAPGAAPLESDTPSEVLARAVANRTLRAASATTLVGLFAEARFSTHTMTEAHREVAERALRTVLDELRVAP